jgi:hypothetical protein
MKTIKPLTFEKSGLSLSEWKVLRNLNTPQKIQDFLNKLPFNFEKNNRYMSPKHILKSRKAHCFEGALLAAAALWAHGLSPLLLDLKVKEGVGDTDHVVVLFNQHGEWGALSKTNHAVLRYREPVYKTVRELAMSYFHEYFLPNGNKTLRSFSKPFDLSKFGSGWISADTDLYHLAEALDRAPHVPILSKKQIQNLRKADTIEIKAGEIEDFKS